MYWIITLIICIVVLALYRFIADMYKDKIELRKQSITEKFAYTVTLINNYAFYGKGKIYSYNMKRFRLYEEGKNQIIQFEYVGGNLLIEWRYKYFHHEVVYKKTFRENRKYGLSVQLKIANELIQEVETVIQNHKIKIINDNKPDPKLVEEMDMLEKIEKANFLKVATQCPEFGYFIDTRDNYKYKTIKIGDQIWLAENLRYTSDDDSLKFNKDFFIYNYYGEKIEEALSTKEYKNYGCLYGFHTLRSVCPPGWHIPSDSEWSLLVYNLGGNNIAALKLISNTVDSIKIPTKESGFSALPGGKRFFGKFCDIKSIGYWWSITTPQGFVPSSAGICWYIDFNECKIDSSLGLQSTFYSVRCIKN